MATRVAVESRGRCVAPFRHILTLRRLAAWFARDAFSVALFCALRSCSLQPPFASSNIRMVSPLRCVASPFRSRIFHLRWQQHRTHVFTCCPFKLLEVASPFCSRSVSSGFRLVCALSVVRWSCQEFAPSNIRWAALGGVLYHHFQHLRTHGCRVSKLMDFFVTTLSD